jgi:hypothetical protein
VFHSLQLPIWSCAETVAVSFINLGGMHELGTLASGMVSTTGLLSSFVPATIHNTIDINLRGINPNFFGTTLIATLFSMIHTNLGGDSTDNVHEREVECGGDRYDRLDEERFAFRTTRDGRVIISYEGRVVTIVTGKKAKKFIDGLPAMTMHEIQLTLARLTGNFKRGNERRSKGL